LSTFQALLTAASVGLALLALLWVRRISARLEQLSQSYWQLKYEHGQLTARLARMEQGEDAHEGPPAPAQTAFVPLSSLRK
jgi:Tfp pilus assembly protein PilN